MATIQICYREKKETHSVMHMQSESLVALAKAMQPYLLVLGASYTKSLIQDLIGFGDDSSVDAPKYEVEFRRKQVLELYAVLCETMHNLTRRQSYDARVVLGESMSLDDAPFAAVLNDDFVLLGTAAQLLRAMKRMLKHNLTLVIQEEA